MSSPPRPAVTSGQSAAPTRYCGWKPPPGRHRCAAFRPMWAGMPGRSRQVPPEQAVASFGSASAFLLALARALDGRDFPYLCQSWLKALPVRASVLLPRPLRCRVYAIVSGREGIAVDRLGDIDLDKVA